MENIVVTVWKFTILDLIGDRFTIQIPTGARLLTLEMQHNEPQIWALVTPSNPLETRHFRIAGTGHSISDTIINYIGTFLVNDDSLVFHIFEVQP